jgi:hypothetical protein
VDVADSPESNLGHTLIVSAFNRRESIVHEGSDSEELGLVDIHSGGHGRPVRQAREKVGKQHVGVDKIRVLGDDRLRQGGAMRILPSTKQMFAAR